MEEIGTKLNSLSISEDSGISVETRNDEANEEKSNIDNIENEANEEDKEEGIKVVAQKGVSITRALIMFGFESWSALEPGNLKSVILIFNYIFLNLYHIANISKS